MSNIIIPAEHQSAPRILVGSNPSNLKPANLGPQDYDQEMDSIVPNDPIIQAQLAEVERQKADKSNNQNIEAVIAEHEKNYNDPRTQAQRWKGQQRWMGKENEQMRLVNIMHPHTFVHRLNRAGIRASLDADLPGQVRHARIWLNSFVRVGRVGVNAWVNGEASTVTTLQYPLGPEWTIMRFNEMDVPTNEKYRGWRTALLALVCSNIITEDEAHRAFGKPIGPAASFYLEQLYEHRKIRLGLSRQ